MTFSRLNYIYNKTYTSNSDDSDNFNNNNHINVFKIMKRTYRNDMTQAQKDKIAQANTGKKLSPETRRRISQSMAKYWAKLPYKPVTSTGDTSGTTTATGTTTYLD